MERFNHAIRSVTIDYNSYLAPSVSLEQDDHLPYPAPQVGYYRWMYDKDPGHQLAALGPVTPPTCNNCGPAVPPPGQPFEYQVLFPAGVPGETNDLWNAQLPEPINAPHGPAPGPSPGVPGTPPQNGPMMPAESVPILPQAPPPVNGPPLSNPLQPLPPGSGRNIAPPVPVPQRLPMYNMPAPNSTPLDQEAPPNYGPSAPDAADVHLTTGQAPTGQVTTGQATRSNPVSAPSAAVAWPPANN
jgi:hypothetical protein